MSKTTKKVPQKAPPTPPEVLGRPSLYKHEYCQALLDYFGRPPYEQKSVFADGIPIIKEVANDFPTLAGFAIKLGVHRDTLQEWAAKHPDFSVVYKRAKDFQENFMAVNGNKGLINTTFAIFTSKNIINWRDQRDKEPSSEDQPSAQVLQNLLEQAKALVDKL